MKRLLCILIWLLCAAALAPAQNNKQPQKPEEKPLPPPDTLFFTLPDSISNEYLDTVKLRKKFLINDYSMIGVHAGVSLLNTSFNPVWNTDFMVRPGNFGISYTRYGKMFGFMPYFGFQVGLFYGYEGYKFKKDKEKDYVRTVEGASRAVMKVVELPLMAHAHVDFGMAKIIADVGVYGAYRWKIDRYGDYVTEGLEHAFKDTDYRFEYGLKGGVGLGFMFDPIEVHVTGLVKWSWQSLYHADWYSQYYYRYAYPFNIEISVGVYYQLTKRSGRTKKMLRETARRVVYGDE